MLKYLLALLVLTHYAVAQTVDTVPVQQWACGAFSAAQTEFGDGYAPGTYTLPLTGGSGTGATAIITVGGAGAVTLVVPNTYGSGFKVGDVLTAALPGNGSGFSLTILATRNLPMDENGTEIRVRPKLDPPFHHHQLPLPLSCIPKP